MSGDLEIREQGHKTRAVVTGTGLNVQGICIVGETLQEPSSSVWPLKTSDAAEAFLQTELSGDAFPRLPGGDGRRFSASARLGLLIMKRESFPFPCCAWTLAALLLVLALLRSKIPLLGRGSLVWFSSVLSLDFLLTQRTGASLSYDLQLMCLTPFPRADVWTD